MFKTIINAWKVKDIRTKMLYTLLLIVVYRLGSFIPVPSVNGEKLGELIASYDFLRTKRSSCLTLDTADLTPVRSDLIREFMKMN